MDSELSATIALSDTTTMNRWETRVLVGVYAGIFLVSAAAIYILYLAAQTVARAHWGVDARLYFQTHLMALLAEMVMWLIIARAAVHLKAYTRAVSNSKDGRALNLIANAFLVSLVYAVLLGMASTAKTLFWNTPYLGIATTVSNLLPLAVALLFAAMLFRGTIRLIGLVYVKCQLFSSLNHFLTVAAYAVAGGLYAWYLYRTAPNILDGDGLRHFALSPLTLLVVYIAPYLAVLLLGLLSCINIGYYGRRVKGLIYKRLFRDVYKGLVISFIGIFLVQVLYLANLSSRHLGLSLLAAAGVIAFLLYGCFLVNRGTSQLAQIEQ